MFERFCEQNNIKFSWKITFGTRATDRKYKAWSWLYKRCRFDAVWWVWQINYRPATEACIPAPRLYEQGVRLHYTAHWCKGGNSHFSAYESWKKEEVALRFMLLTQPFLSYLFFPLQIWTILVKVNNWQINHGNKMSKHEKNNNKYI